MALGLRWFIFVRNIFTKETGFLFPKKYNVQLPWADDDWDENAAWPEETLGSSYNIIDDATGALIRWEE